MESLKLWLVCLIFIFLSQKGEGQTFDSIRNYKVDWALLEKKDSQLIGIRSFTANNKTYLLAVDPLAMQTRVVPSDEYKRTRLTFADISAQFNKMPYIRSFDLVRRTEQNLQNAGLDFHMPKEQGINLTIDLCPSHKPFDRIIFQSLFSAFKGKSGRLPVAISVSGKWMLKHQEDLNWLRNLDKDGALQITWVNHSYSHVFSNQPLTSNFLLTKGTNMDVEVLENEKLMLRNGILPSVFFRCPGLVSDKAVIDKLLSYGLIAVGSDAWLAKGQHPVAGSIVLIHGNGNEELGVKDFIKLLQQENPAIRSGHWTLYNLSEGLEHE
ncbi:MULTISPECIES: polysaccharide deacetylase [unclassified Sphingobacterium]|uniref:polysaccharide deacetylase family protein n=1 Tax=unclassified Sphingobacterium TaxID=2609468 RepID=UPI0025DBD99C|nr:MULTISPECIES: polysaccharide deacetylase [unclassified Sphingobacterium]